MERIMETILPKVQKPARYTGGEYNAVVKDLKNVDTRFALCFPDTYEIGMSNLGIRILYGLLNEMKGVWCERVFAPWGDMEEEMRRANLPLYGLESGDSIGNFDVIGFSLGYEMAFTNVLNMLDLAGLPLRTADRTVDMPLIVAGGTCAFNSEPLTPFVDAFMLGEGEDVIRELVECYQKGRDAGWSRKELLIELARIPGIYVPSLYEVTYKADGTVEKVEPLEGAPAVVTKRIVQNFDESYFPTKTIIPSTEIVHDRVMLECFRGCVRACRFCQAGYAYRPVRSRDPKRLLEQGIEASKNSGYQEITLSSLSTSDYRPLTDLCDDLLEWCEPNKVSLSLPSLRADNFSMSLMQRLQKVRKSGLTFAPEAGTQRLRDAINKNVLEEDLLRSCRTAFSGGWSSLKLYFMLGLPTETDEDVIGIAELTKKVLQVWKESATDKRRGCKITISTACFVPKPHTAFQWEDQVTREEYLRRVNLIRDEIRKEKSISYNWHDPETSFMEAVFSRGDRRLADVLESAWKAGSKFESWTEYFSLERWLKAMEENGVDPNFYAYRVREKDEVMPWDHLSTGVTKRFLWAEHEQAMAACITPDCRQKCSGCGANKLQLGGVCDG